MTTNHSSKGAYWTGWVISGLCILFLLFDSIVKLIEHPMAIEGSAPLGYSADQIFPLGVILLISTLLYAIPGTAVLGTILLTAYLGGATATHVRVDQPFYFPVVFAILVWAGIYLRETRLRTLIPFIKKREAS